MTSSVSGRLQKKLMMMVGRTNCKWEQKWTPIKFLKNQDGKFTEDKSMIDEDCGRGRHFDNDGDMDLCCWPTLEIIASAKLPKNENI